MKQKQRKIFHIYSYFHIYIHILASSKIISVYKKRSVCKIFHIMKTSFFNIIPQDVLSQCNLFGNLPLYCIASSIKYTYEIALIYSPIVPDRKPWAVHSAKVLNKRRQVVFSIFTIDLMHIVGIKCLNLTV